METERRPIMLRGICSKTCMTLVLTAIFLSLPVESFAQRRVKPQPKKVKIVAPKRRSPNVVKPPVGHKTVIVGGIHYYHHNGVFYKKGASGYLVVRAPVGARIKALPAGYVTILVRKKPYYYYYGTYYVYHPDEEAYVVVESPDSENGEEENLFDKITLIDGRSLEGIYLGRTVSMIQFEVAADIMEFPTSEIITITFAQPVEIEEE